MPLLFLEEYLDTAIALPTEVQRSLSQIKEQDGLNQACSQQVLSGITRLLASTGPSNQLSAEEASKLLDEIKEGFIEGLAHAEERVALAGHIHQSVKGHIVKLEDDLKHFEEEVRLAKLAESNRTIAHFEDHNEDEDELDDEVVQMEEKKRIAENKRKRTKSREEIGEGRRRSRMTEPVPAVVSPKPSPSDLTTGGEERTYCYCGQPSYGEMIGCDAHEDCEIEWFHYGCVGLESPPKDQWFCPDCIARMARNPVGVAPAPKDGSGSKKPRPTFVK